MGVSKVFGDAYMSVKLDFNRVLGVKAIWGEVPCHLNVAQRDKKDVVGQSLHVHENSISICNKDV